jgi:lipopolysaccharide export system protein LptA
MCTRSIATRAILLTAALMAGTATAPIRAQETADAVPAEPPVVIDAERSYYDLRSGVTRFEDNVSITRGAMAVEADRGVVRQTDGQITEVELEGAPSTWRDRLEDGSIVTGEARDIRFDVLANVITLTGNAIIRHEQGEFTGDELVYDLNAESLAGRSTGDERVRVVIEPGAMSDPRPAPPLSGEAPAGDDGAPDDAASDPAPAEDAGPDEATAEGDSDDAIGDESDDDAPDPEPPADPDGR